MDPANGEEMNSDDDDVDDDYEMDDSSGEDGDDDDYEDSISAEKIDDEVIVEQFIHTFHNGDYDTEFDKALSFDRSVVLPNTQPTQASYNKSENWRERNRIGLEKVKRQLENLIESVSNSHSFCLQLRLRYNRVQDLLMDSEESIVWHEPILDHCWDQLENEIDRNCQLGIVEDICDIQLENVEITKERMAALVEILSSGRATYSGDAVYFNNANLCGDGIKSLSKLVEACSELRNLIINHNRINDMESAHRLSRSLRSHTCIEDLIVQHCDLGSSPEILSVILQSDVKYITLENNNIDSFGAVTIAEYLERDPPIELLSLDHNRLNDDDAVLISQALKMNTNLRRIDLRSNNFTANGVKALLTCAFDNTSLNSISESNHMLTEMNIFSVWASKNLAGCIDRLLQLDSTQKILLALQDKDSLLKYLANVPVELIPEVLAFPLRRVVDEHQHKYLNIVYSTMRWWNMPLIYSYHKLCGATISDTKRKRDN
jgi:Ran GTPase-activating protein (RanGAP) involved in mRNA processing and transport